MDNAEILFVWDQAAGILPAALRVEWIIRLLDEAETSGRVVGAEVSGWPESTTSIRRRRKHKVNDADWDVRLGEIERFVQAKAY